MDVNVLRDKIRECPEKIETVLTELGFQDIRFHQSQHSYFSFPRIGGDRPNGTSLYCESLRYTCWTQNDSGDLISLTMKTRSCTLPQAIKFICKVLNIEDKYQQVHLPFGGFYKKLTRDWNLYGGECKKYQDGILRDYPGLSQMFLEDGIDLLTQERFEIGFDHINNATIIPVRDINGGLIGAKARNNNKNAELESRYWAILPFSKSLVVYGLYQNYESIMRKGKVVIVEAEKSVMQAASFDCNIVVAIGGHCISETQARILKSLMLDEYIVAFDEGISEEEIQAECEKLKLNLPSYTNTVKYLYDGKNQYLKYGSKDSPTDNGREVFGSLMKNCCYT